MIKSAIRQTGAAGLAAAVFLAGIAMVDVSPVRAVSPTDAPVTVMPFPDQWKYYGQTKSFREDENYSLSTEPKGFSAGDWSLAPGSEEIGSWPYVLQYHTANVDGQKLVLAADAPRFEIREYKAPVAVEPDLEYHNSTEYTVCAPAGYQISGGKDSQGDWDWQDELEAEGLHEGENAVTYYLRSKENNQTKNAIDRTPKTAVVLVDTIAPALTSLQITDCGDVSAAGTITGNEPGKFYYLVLPSQGAPQGGVTEAMIRENVAAGRGIGGYGRVDGTGSGAPVRLNGLMAETDYTAYAFMEDKAGNCSPVRASAVFSTEKTVLSGAVDVSGTPALDSVLTAVPRLDSVDPGTLSYQWYRIRLEEDDASFGADEDETGAEEEPDGADGPDTEEEPGDGESDGEEEDQGELETLAAETGQAVSIDGAEAIPGAAAATYKVTREDIGCRLIACVRASNYSGYAAGITGTFVPKLMPAYQIPAVAKAAYSPVKTLADVKLPGQWSWVDPSIVPVYGNDGYRARFVPEDTSVYKSVIVKIRVPMTRRALKKSMVKIASSQAYAGKAIRDNFTLTDQGEKLAAKKDFTASYKNNVKPGKAYVTLKGTGNYTGSVKVSYTIKKKSIQRVTAAYEKTRVYTGKKQTAGLVLKNGSVKLKKGRDYTLSYKKNVEIGRASVTVKGIGNYSGTRKFYFSIVPSGPSVKAVKRGSGTFRLVLSAKQKVTGYLIYVSPSAAFAKKSTQVFLATGSSFGMDNLAKGAVYYVRIKAYSSVGGKRYISGYSKAVKIKIK